MPAICPIHGGMADACFCGHIAVAQTLAIHALSEQYLKNDKSQRRPWGRVLFG